jgi:PAS domain S-box-containing protein
MPWLRHRTIRSQLTLGFIALELLFTLCFSLLILSAELNEIHARAQRRIEQQTNLLATVSADVLADQQQERLEPLVRAVRASAFVQSVRLTDAAGNPLLAGAAPGLVDMAPLRPSERRQLPLLGKLHGMGAVFQRDDGLREGVRPIRSMDAVPRVLGYAWVTENRMAEQEEVRSLTRITLFSGLLGAIGCVLASALLARSITRPLKAVMDATRRLIRDPQTKEGFPLQVEGKNEAAELAHAFNLLVLSMEEQRSGLNDTLALLDSMLARAPIGFAFLDAQLRFIRVNRFLADSMGIGLTEFLGRTAQELFSPAEAEVLERRTAEVFGGSALIEPFEMEIEAEAAAREEDAPGQARSWLVSMYPVKSGQDVRWVGAVMIDTTERRRSEETLRRTEKLAAAGQLAASIAHEINNPLEAVTNLLFLLSVQPSLDGEARRFAEMAQHELARVSEIAQQTLRFYKPSTAPAVANVAEVLDSMLTLHSGRIHTLRVDVERRYSREVELYCMAGGLRQVFANLITNALDALEEGGRLYIRACPSRSWKDGRAGVRVVVADNGCGMSAAVRRRIYEPFFTTKMATGTGLGLWVTQDILAKHQGTIAVRSRAESPGPRGTVFMLFFPEDGVQPAVPAELQVAAEMS